MFNFREIIKYSYSAEQERIQRHLDDVSCDVADDSDFSLEGDHSEVGFKNTDSKEGNMSNDPVATVLFGERTVNNVSWDVRTFI